MKTAVSLPDALYTEAEQLATFLGAGRSRLYADALAAHLERCRSTAITRRLDDVYETNASALDPDVTQHLGERLRSVEW
jgi:metal-responsive CopG/Arc/MetJ family transcriptional regulator